MITTEALRQFPMLEDLPEEHLAWFARQGEEVRLKAGETLFVQGDAPEWMYVFFEGELHGRRETDLDARVFIARAGDITGVLPYSRMKVFGGTGRAVVPTYVGRFHKKIFPEMLSRMPVLSERFVGMMTDRVRETTKDEQQRDKLMALGKLSAGLAHELNNPAAAAKRAADTLREVRERLRKAYLELDRRNLTSPQREFIADFECRVNERAGGKLPGSRALESRLTQSPLEESALDQSDREEELSAWMERHNVGESWTLAQALVEAGVDPASLDELARNTGVDAIGDVLNRIVLTLEANRLVHEIEQSTGRISKLVCAIKEYSYMDRAPIQEVDVQAGIESTLTILGFKLRNNNVSVERNYDPELPRISAWGSELNQVWTNLIDNAADAMSGGGKLRVHTARDGDAILVEVGDTGSGIPDDVKPHLFEPFFTTKGVGQGTGLGLDTVRRIVRKHRGEVTFQSKPGDTRFCVRLPVEQPQ